MKYSKFIYLLLIVATVWGLTVSRQDFSPGLDSQESKPIKTLLEAPRSDVAASRSNIQPAKNSSLNFKKNSSKQKDIHDPYAVFHSGQATNDALSARTRMKEYLEKTIIPESTITENSSRKDVHDPYAEFRR